MKIQRLLVIFFFLGCVRAGYAQTVANSYTFTLGFSDYITYSGGTIFGNSQTDNSVFNNIPIGFTFIYNSNAYNSISINPNGYIAFGTTVSPGGVGISYLSNNNKSGAALASALGSNNIVAGFNLDLQNSSPTSLSSNLIGNAPNRKQIIQWKNVRKFFVSADTFNFQIQLLEGTNQIKVNYGFNTYSIASNPLYAQVGLRGASNADVNSLKSLTGWLSVTQGTSNVNSILISNTLVPFPNMEYTWTPSGNVKDIALLKILHPITNGCLLSSAESFKFVIQNRGLIPIDMILAGYTINNTFVRDTFFLNQPLFQGYSDTIEFLMQHDLSAIQAFPVEAFVYQPGETVLSRNNDTIRDTIYSMNPISSFPYTEGFNSTSKLPRGWQTDKQTGTGWKVGGPVFEIGQAGGTNINSVVGNGVLYFNSFLAENTGKYSSLYSPCIDLSSVESDSSFQLQIGYLQGIGLLGYVDSIVVRLSTNAGSTYDFKLGKLLRPSNQAGTVQWSIASIDLSAFRGVSSCKLSFTAFGSYGFNMAIDFCRIKKVGFLNTSDEIKSNAISIYPNPARNSFRFSDSEPSDVLIYNSSGALIKSVKLSADESIDVSRLVPGIYSVGRKHHNKIIWMKFIKE